MTNLVCLVALIWVIKKLKITPEQKTVSQISRDWENILWTLILDSGPSEVVRFRCLFFSRTTLPSLAPFTWIKSKKETDCLVVVVMKGSLSSSWMNSPIPSLLFPLWQNESLCKTIGMKIYVTCIFIRIKIKSFSCETISTSTRSKKEANGNSEVKVKSAYVPSGSLGQHLFQFL